MSCIIGVIYVLSQWKMLVILDIGNSLSSLVLVIIHAHSLTTIIYNYRNKSASHDEVIGTQKPHIGSKLKNLQKPKSEASPDNAMA